MADDPYVYPGTDVLRNRLDILEAADLADREAALSAIRIAQLERRFIPGGYDLAHLQATHHYIFGDLYPWAGELRTVRITKGGDLFALPEHISPYLTTLFSDLAREDFLHSLDHERFVKRLTHYVSYQPHMLLLIFETTAGGLRSARRTSSPAGTTTTLDKGKVVHRFDSSRERGSQSRRGLVQRGPRQAVSKTSHLHELRHYLRAAWGTEPP
jgi:hypothetical protein